jgi:hypothetical protein
MAYFFDAPDFYKMAQDSRARFDKQIDDFVTSGPAAQYARYKAAKEAKEREARRDARAEEWDSLLMGRMGLGMQPVEQAQPIYRQQENYEAPAMLDPSQLTPEQLEQLQQLYGGGNGYA